MKRKMIWTRVFISTLVLFIGFKNGYAQTKRDTTQSSLNGGGFFTDGTASVIKVNTVPEMKCGVAKVTFEKGARTIWHSHAGGQVIVVTSGTAWYQEKGKPKQILRVGETVVAAPGVMHWHGASPEGPMSHTVANTNLDMGGVTAGRSVTEEEYKSIAGKQ